jgi:3-hydroxyacyl-[acyl-carrier-protein] dehydratase
MRIMPPTLHIDLSTIDMSRIIADQAAIRTVNPQRFEMEQLTAIVHIDKEAQLCIGYKDVRHDEFWVKGHMPGYPLMPGVLICEAAAQLCSYYITVSGLMQKEFLGFGGLENVRFRVPVKPGDRLLLVAKGLKYNRRQTLFNVQGFVGTTMVFHGDVLGVAMSRSPGEPT